MQSEKGHPFVKGQLPKAYLRIDPNLDQTHADPGAFVRLLCVAARQPKRGRFKDRRVAEQALGRRLVAAFLAHRDLIEKGGALEVDGWDIWQEGDMTVGERMRRYRNKHVTPAFPVTPDLPSPPSEALGSKASGVEERTERALVVSDSDKAPNGNGNGVPEEQRQRYAEEVWSEFLRVSGQRTTRLASPSEFAMLKSWMDAGIPLRIVLRGLTDCVGKGKSLNYYAPAVLEAIEANRQAVPL